jgi:hypothetical protein
MLAIRARAVSQWNDLSLRGGTAKATRARFLLPVLTFDAPALHRFAFSIPIELDFASSPSGYRRRWPFLIVAGARFIAANPLVPGRLPTQSSELYGCYSF